MALNIICFQPCDSWAANMSSSLCNFFVGHVCFHSSSSHGFVFKSASMAQAGFQACLFQKNDPRVPPCRVCFAPAFFHEISNLTWNPCTLSMRSADVCLSSQSALWPASTSEHLWCIICSWSHLCCGPWYSTLLGYWPCGAMYKLPLRILELPTVLNGKIGAEYIKDSQKELMRPQDGRFGMVVVPSCLCSFLEEEI